MGSHGKCTDRFPKHFEKFMESDYSDKSKHQRKNYADYDNTVLYNDYVISKLIEQVNPYEAIVLYFPDHGVDFYYTRDDYAGHGIIDNPKSSAAGCQIPFIIYCTQKYNKRFPKTARILRKHIDNKFETCNLIYTVLDIAGYDLPDNSVSLNSLFKGDFLYSK